MTIVALVPLLIPSTFVLFLVLERCFPGRPQPRVKRWFGKGLAFFLAAGALNALVPPLVVAATGGPRLVDLAPLGVVGGALVMLVTVDLVQYTLHRTMHRLPWLWRWTHQLHHSAERVDILGAAYNHPFDLILGTLLPATLVASALGVRGDAAALAGYLAFALGYFSHLAVRTPRWFGYLLQRPEMHAVHHTRGVHAYNYGTLALPDLLFGTWRNPAGYGDRPSGFWDGASARLGAMLAGRDVGEPPADRGSPDVGLPPADRGSRALPT